MDLNDDLFRQLTAGWQAGERVFVEALLAKQVVAPVLDSGRLLELIFHEIEIRDQQADSPQLEEYRQRFPQLAEDLETDWALRRALKPHGDSATRSVAIDTTFADSETGPANFDSTSRYEIRDELGRGAIGVVFRAWDKKLKRWVAIKRLRTGLDAGVNELQRMQAEAHAIAQLHHPGIMQIFDVGSSDGVPFLAVEYCAGGTLADRIRGKPMPFREAAELVHRIALGVAAAHEARIILRDLKPGNILLTGADWIPKIGDFGLAKLLDNDSDSTATGSILGSPSYMAPEQAFGDSNLVGPESDIYSLGAILYECLTGRPPFRGVTVVETLDQVRRQEPISIRKLEPHVPLDVETIAHKCLRKDPAQRYESASAMADDLRRYLNHEAILARQERWHELGLRIVKRYPVIASLIATSVVLLLTLVIGSLGFARYLYDTRAASRQSERQARLGQAESLVGRAHGIRLSGQAGQRFEALQSLRAAAEIGRNLQQPQAWFEPLRDEAISALLLPDTQVDWLEPESAPVFCGVINSDKTRVALALANGKILVRSLPDKRIVVELPIHSTIPLVQFIGSDFLLTIETSDGSVALWKMNRSDALLQWNYHPVNLATNDPKQFHSAVSRDQKTLVLTNSNELIAINIADGKRIARWSTRPFSQQLRLALHPEQDWIGLHSYFHPFIELRNWRTGQVLCHLTPEQVADDHGFSGADWSTDGAELLVLGGHGRVLNRYELEETAGQLVLKQSYQSNAKNAWPAGAELRWDSQNDRIFFRDWSDNFVVHDFRNGIVTACEQGFVSNGTFNHSDIQIGSVVVHSGGAPRPGIMSWSVGQEARCVSGTPDKSRFPLPECYHSVFDPTGRFIVTTTRDGLAMIDAARGQLIGRLNFPYTQSFKVAFDNSNHFYFSTQLGAIRCSYTLIESSGELKIGLPARVHFPPCSTTIACSDDGKTLVGGAYNGYDSAEYAGVWLKTAGEPAARWSQTSQSAGQGAVTPDGTRVATNSSDQFTIFDMQQNCRVVLAAPPIQAGPLRFIANGQQLIAGDRLLDADTGTELKSWDAAVQSLAQDEQTALGLSRSGTSAEAITIFNLETGKTWAKIHSLNQPTSVSLSPDKTRLAITSDYRVWFIDLLAIRAGLTEQGLGFGWDKFLDRLTPPRPVPAAELPAELQQTNSLNVLFQNMDRRTLVGAKEHCNEGDWQFSAGLAAIETRDLPAAIEYLTRSAELLPDAQTPRLWRAFVRAEIDDYAGAIADVDWVLERSDEPRAWLMRSEWNFRLHRYEEAIKDCTNCLDRQFPQVRLTLALRARCYLALERATEAAADEKLLADKEVASLGQKVDSIHSLVGPDLSLRRSATALFELEKMKQTSEYQSAGQEAGLAREMAYVEGLVNFRNGNFAAAIAAVQRNLNAEANGHEPLSHLICALAHGKLKQVAAARQHLKLAGKKSTMGLLPHVVREIDLLHAEALRSIPDEADQPD